nr:MAG TPA: hypothetical protein [Caudoviricetes sp.]
MDVLLKLITVSCGLTSRMKATVLSLELSRH